MTETYKARTPIWCSGCGHFVVETALRQALAVQGIKPYEVMVLAGIGCSGTIQNNLGAYGYHALHGRVLPTATGLATSNPRLTVIAAGGDGDGYAIGIGHLIHTFRRNPNLLYIVMNNATYGLTKGQPSPTSQAVDKEQEHPVDAIQLGLTIQGASFLARGFVGYTDQLDRVMAAALAHVRARRGFAFVEVISPCVTYNDSFTQWGGRLQDVEQEAGYNPADRTEMITRCAQLNAGNRVPTGIIYNSSETTYEELLGISTDSAPALQPVDPGLYLDSYRKIMAQYVI